MKQHRSYFSLLAASMLVLVLRGRLTAQTYSAIDYPGAVKTITLGINSGGVIVGDFCIICKNNERVHGYILNQGTFKQFDFPGSVLTRPLGINDAGEVVGYFRKTTNGPDHGFLLSGGTFTAIDFPGSTQTHAIGINTAGEIFGSYCIGGNACYGNGSHLLYNAHGFRLSGGIFTTIDFPGSLVTELWGQDSAGQIAGRYQDPSGAFHAFLLSNGSFISIDFPGAAETAAEWISFVGGISPSGDIASTYCTSEPCVNPSSNFHSFLLSGGTYTTIDFPGAAVTIAAGVNSSVEVVGAFFDSNGGTHGFLRVP